MHILKNENKIEDQKKIKRFIITLSVLVLCSVFFQFKRFWGVFMEYK